MKIVEPEESKTTDEDKTPEEDNTPDDEDTSINDLVPKDEFSENETQTDQDEEQKASTLESVS